MERLIGITQLTLHKVKAFLEADRSNVRNFLRWTINGNIAAGSAAKNCQMQEFTLLRNMADTIAEDCLYHLQQFCRCLVELNIAEIRLRETAMATDIAGEISEDQIRSFSILGF